MWHEIDGRMYPSEWHHEQDEAHGAAMAWAAGDHGQVDPAYECWIADQAAAERDAQLEPLREAARRRETPLIVDAIRALAGASTTEERMARAALIDVYEERAGGQAADRLMDELGL